MGAINFHDLRCVRLLSAVVEIPPNTPGGKLSYSSVLALKSATIWDRSPTQQWKIAARSGYLCRSPLPSFAISSVLCLHLCVTETTTEAPRGHRCPPVEARATAHFLAKWIYRLKHRAHDTFFPNGSRPKQGSKNHKNEEFSAGGSVSTTKFYPRTRLWPRLKPAPQHTFFPNGCHKFSRFTMC